MATWTTISNAAVAVGGIPSSTTVTALRDNVEATAQAVNGAPVVFAGWHPVTKTSIGDGVTGKIYDFDINGVVASVTTPTFEDGYEYRLVGSASHNNGTNTTLLIGAFLQNNSSWYDTIGVGPSVSSSTVTSFDVTFPLPRLARSTHLIPTMIGPVAAVTAFSPSTLSDPENKRISQARIIYPAGSIDQGRIWFFRRREYASSP